MVIFEAANFTKIKLMPFTSIDRTHPRTNPMFLLHPHLNQSEIDRVAWMGPQIIPCLSYFPAEIMVISMRSTRVKQFL